MRAVLSRLLCRQSLPILLPRRPQVREDALKKQPLGSRAETHAAIRTLLASLGDPFTRFLDPEQYAALR
jgi:C-terminal processing protease CtpA/Prc